MKAQDTSRLPYRACVGIVLAGPGGRIFAGERIDTPGAWQMPQGGIDDDETPRQAALRELTEETGLAPDLVSIEAEFPEWIAYDLPDYLVGKVWKGRYRGQQQRWFLMRLLGRDDQISIDSEDPEFSRWRWLDPDELIARIVPFKRDIYREVIGAFRDRLATTD